MDQPLRHFRLPRLEWKPDATADEKTPASVKLTVIHEMPKPGSKFIERVSNGWPLVLASLKSLLETGEPLPGISSWADHGCEPQ